MSADSLEVKLAAVSVDQGDVPTIVALVERRADAE